MRRIPLHPLLAASPLLLAVAATPTGPAQAQLGTARPATPPPSSTAAPAQRPPPPALPGLAGRRAPEPIPGDPAQNLSPNAALFDAINRGDLAAARDAVARGADLGARNVLGLTPLDAAVDQGRQEIVFYLLSARGAVRGSAAGPPSPPTDAAATLDGPAAPRRGAAAAAGSRQTPREAERRAGAPSQAPISPAAAAEAARTPRLFAGDGGAPQPEIGFLGFDAGRPAGAVPVDDQAPPRRARPGGRGGRG